MFFSSSKSEKTSKGQIHETKTIFHSTAALLFKQISHTALSQNNDFLRNKQCTADLTYFKLLQRRDYKKIRDAVKS